MLAWLWLGLALAEPPPSDSDAPELVLVKQVSPDYPEEAKKMEFETPPRCIAAVYIGLDGVPYDVAIDKCAGVFHAATREALLQWRWRPVLVGGEPVRSQTTVGVTFRVESAKERRKRRKRRRAEARKG